MGFHYWDTARKRDCESSMTIREEALANDKAAFRALGRELGASNERTERFITDVIDKNYHDLPKPASCN